MNLLEMLLCDLDIISERDPVSRIKKAIQALQISPPQGRPKHEIERTIGALSQDLKEFIVERADSRNNVLGGDTSVSLSYKGSGRTYSQAENTHGVFYIRPGERGGAEIIIKGTNFYSNSNDAKIWLSRNAIPGLIDTLTQIVNAYSPPKFGK
jgi:hypothetical protein